MRTMLPMIGTAFAASLCAVSGSALNPVDVSLFDPAQYCDAIDRRAEKTKPDQIEAILSQDDPTLSIDGFEVANAVLIGGAIDVAHASPDAESCRETFARGKALFDATYADALDGVMREKRHKYKKKDPVRSIQQEITRLWQEDQAGRFAFLQLRTEDTSSAEFWAQRLSVANSRSNDERSKRYLESILADFDWIDRRRFGRSVSDHAWILVQHADAYPEFQAEALERMQPYVENGGVRPKHFAYLYDRVAVNTGRKQRYGTQPTWECEEDGSMQLKPLEDPESVNARRKDMGLNSVEEGLAEMSRQVCGS